MDGQVTSTWIHVKIAHVSHHHVSCGGDFGMGLDMVLAAAARKVSSSPELSSPGSSVGSACCDPFSGGLITTGTLHPWNKTWCHLSPCHHCQSQQQNPLDLSCRSQPAKVGVRIDLGQVLISVAWSTCRNNYCLARPYSQQSVQSPRDKGLHGEPS